MKIVVLVLMGALAFCGASYAGQVDYGPYAEFLKEYTVPDVTVKGARITAVDYRRATMNSVDTSDPYFRALEVFMMADPAALGTREEKVAFWINAYNMAAIKMIVDYYPVDSIRSTKISLLTLPWKKGVLYVRGHAYSLHEIEHEMLLGELSEPLAHFGVVCASISCVDLMREPYTPEDVYGRLEDSARGFVNNTQKGVLIDRAKAVVYISKIFHWGEDDFEKIGGVREVIARFLADPSEAEYIRNGKYDIRYLDYDWDLNAYTGGR